MIIERGFTLPDERERGFTLPELMISSTIFSFICLGLLMGFVALERNYAATTDFAVNHADEMRISDYMALDLRRALAVNAAQNDTTIYIPSYYDAQGNPQTPELDVDGKGGVHYGVIGSSVRIRYYLSGGTIYRQQDNGKPVALAVNVQDFVFNVTDAGKVVQTRINFNPTFSSSGASASATAATAFYNTTLLRNSRTDIQSSVY
jgi:prepilin-type N-terminal cleavage/methylation domain-containing protein